jgi:hypothetical protein
MFDGYVMGRRIAQLIAAVAFLVSLAWIYRHPAWESVTAGLSALVAFVGLLIEQNIYNNKKSDRRLFEQFKRVLPSDGSVAFIDTLSMAAGSFHPANLDDLDNFADTWNDAEHEFLDRKLERKRKHLLKLIKEYRLLVGGNTFRTRDGEATVPPEWESEQPDRFNQAVNILHDKAGEVVEAHQQLIRLARKKLEVS